MRKILSLIIFICIGCHAYGEKAAMVFPSDKDVSVMIYSPIDGAYNYLEETDRLQLKPNINITYSIDIDKFAYVQLKYSTGLRYTILLEEGSNLEVIHTGDELIFRGDNAEGQIFLRSTTAREYVSGLNDLFNSSIDSEDFNLEQIFDYLPKLEEEYAAALAELETAGKITPSFKTTAQKAYMYGIYGRVIENYVNLMVIKNEELTKAQSEKMDRLIDSIYALHPVEMDDNIIKYPTKYNYVMFYYLRKSWKTDNEVQYDKDTFGPYARYLLAPDHIRLSNFGSAFLVEFLFGTNEFDKEKMLAYLQEHYPDAEYTALITEKMKAYRKKMGMTEDKLENVPVIVDKKIDRLGDIVSIEGIKDRYVFIDMWATWCAPCKMEFPFNESLHELLDGYGNVAQVYVSIDDDGFDKKWRDEVKELGLAGFNIRASAELKADIEDNIYVDESFSIPRYILLDPEGKVAARQLPRPSSIDKLKEELDKILK